MPDIINWSMDTNLNGLAVKEMLRIESVDNFVALAVKNTNLSRDEIRFISLIPPDNPFIVWTASSIISGLSSNSWIMAYDGIR